MPRQAKGPRLYLETRADRAAVWVIRDGNRKVSTGCAESQRAEAERRLEAYRAETYRPERGDAKHPSNVLIADVLNIYLADRVPAQARPKEAASRILKLAEFFGTDTLDTVTGPACRAYARHRASQTAARRELEDLRAAIIHHRREGLCNQIVEVILPERSQPRERWLTRSEAARLLLTAWRRSPHVARFILVGLYTGTRSGAILGASLTAVSGKGWVDLSKGVFYRKAFGAARTKKRQPPVPIPDRLLAHIRRWQAKGHCKKALIEFDGAPILRITKAFDRAVEAAGLGDGVTPHTLRHTAATWMVENGVETGDVAKFLGMTEAMVEDRYGHIGSKALARAAEGLTRQKRDR